MSELTITEMVFNILSPLSYLIFWTDWNAQTIQFLMIFVDALSHTLLCGIFARYWNGKVHGQFAKIIYLCCEMKRLNIALMEWKSHLRFVLLPVNLRLQRNRYAKYCMKFYICPECANLVEWNLMRQIFRIKLIHSSHMHISFPSTKHPWKKQMYSCCAKFFLKMKMILFFQTVKHWMPA